MKSRRLPPAAKLEELGAPALLVEELYWQSHHDPTLQAHLALADYNPEQTLEIMLKALCELSRQNRSLVDTLVAAASRAPIALPLVKIGKAP